MAIGAEIAKLFVTIGADIKEFQSKMNTVDGGLKGLGPSIGRAGKTALKAATVATAAIGTAVAGISVASFNAAADFESAFAGVKKTVDATDEELSKLEQGIRDLAKTVPAGTTEIAAVAEAAGQLGIKTENILGFTKAMIDLGETTNLSSEEGATALAQFANITQMSQADFDRLGSTIVALGNAGASTEADIVNMGLRLAGAGEQVGMTEAQILSLASGLSSLGIEADAGGSAMSRVMVDMKVAAEMGGQALEDFASVSGMSAAEFKDAYTNDAMGALNSFITGLGGLEAKGGSAIVTLEGMGISEIRMRDALLRASSAGSLLTDAIEVGNKAWEENNALQKEAEQRYATTQSQMKIFKNNINDMAISLGQKLLPSVNEVLKGTNAALADGFQPGDIKAIGTLISDKIMEGLKSFSDNAPEIISILSETLTEVVQLLVKVLPTLLPALLQGVMDIVEGLLNAILENAQPLADMVLQLVNMLVTFLAENLPVLLNAAYMITIALANGLAESLPTLIPVIIDMVLMIVDVMLDNMPLLVNAAFQLLRGLQKGLFAALPELLKKVPEIIWGIIVALDSAIGSLVSYGGDLIAGLWKGISDAGQWLNDKIAGFFSGVVDNIKDFFGINSPSKLLEDEIGINLPLGVEVGVTKGGKGLLDSINKLSEAATVEFGTGAVDGLKSGIDRFDDALTDYAPGANENMAFTQNGSKLGYASAVSAVGEKNNKVEHSGTITVKGVNNKDELIGTYNILMENLKREARLA